jgi:diguanylate cyclase (GGDEF)-like protein
MTKLTPKAYSLLPRLDDTFILVRILAFIGMGLWAIVVPDSILDNLPALILIAVFAAHLLFFLFSITRKLIHFKKLYYSILAYDIVFLALLTRYTGGFESHLSILYFTFLPFATYVLGVRAGVFAAAAATATYLAANLTPPETAFPAYLLLYIAVLWLFCVGTGYFSNASKQSEKRLLSALDKLNERTTELERAHRRLEMVYEASRNLGAILKVEDLIQNVLTVSRDLFRYPICEILLWDAKLQKLFIHGRIENKDTAIYPRPRAVRITPAFKEILETGRPRRTLLQQGSRRETDAPGMIRSQLAVPMTSQGKTIGILSAESPDLDSFGERDEHSLAILANSAALALENAFLHQQMEQLTISDELTGIYNYRFFKLRLEDEMRRSVRYGQSLSLIMIDIDWFKRFNDTYGHETGNRLLREIVRVIADCVRDVDILARYGGEEFIIILPQTGQAEAYKIGERIRQRIADSRFEIGPDGKELVKVTVSIGISCYPENGRGENDLVESVDQALYRAKGAGKNLVCTV